MSIKKYKDIRIDFTIYADDEHMPSPQGLSSGINEGLPKEWFNGEGDYQVTSTRFGHFEDPHEEEFKQLHGQVDELKHLLVRKDDEINNLRTIRDRNAGVLQNLVEKNANQSETILNAEAKIEEVESHRDDLIRQVGDQQQVISDQIKTIGTMTDNFNDKRNRIIALETVLSDLKSAKVKSVGITTQEYEQVREAIHRGIDQVGQARIEDATGALDNLFEEVDDALKTLPVMDERDLGWGDDEQLTELEAVSSTITDQATELAAMLNNIRTER